MNSKAHQSNFMPSSNLQEEYLNISFINLYIFYGVLKALSNKRNKIREKYKSCKKYQNPFTFSFALFKHAFANFLNFKFLHH